MTNMNPGLLRNVNISLLTQDTTGNATTGGTNIPGVVDMQGYDGCLFIAETWSTQIDANTCTLSIAEGATTAAFVSLSAGGATAYTTAANSTSAELICIDVFRPRDRYLQANVNATAGHVYSVLAIQYTGRKPPITQASDDVPSVAVAYVATPST